MPRRKILVELPALLSRDIGLRDPLVVQADSFRPYPTCGWQSHTECTYHPCVTRQVTSLLRHSSLTLLC